MSEINGFKIEKIKGYIESVKNNPKLADRNPHLVATWEGADKAKVEFGNISASIGGENNFSAMNMLLATLAACDIEVITTHASILGVEIENLSIEATGYFNVQTFLGIKDDGGSGYKSISYKVRLNAPEATSQQIDILRNFCERSSPVGNTLASIVPLELEFELSG